MTEREALVKEAREYDFRMCHGPHMRDLVLRLASALEQSTGVVEDTHCGKRSMDQMDNILRRAATNGLAASLSRPTLMQRLRRFLFR